MTDRKSDRHLNTAAISVRISEEEKAALRARCEVEDRTQTAVVVRALRYYLKETKP